MEEEGEEEEGEEKEGEEVEYEGGGGGGGGGNGGGGEGGRGEVEGEVESDIKLLKKEQFNKMNILPKLFADELLLQRSKLARLQG